MDWKKVGVGVVVAAALVAVYAATAMPWGYGARYGMPMMGGMMGYGYGGMPMMGYGMYGGGYQGYQPEQTNETYQPQSQPQYPQTGYVPYGYYGGHCPMMGYW
jgi:hypothetical protein